METQLLLAMVQGFTEFLPISSSGHVYLIGNVISSSHGILYLIIWLHAGSLFAVLLYYHRYIWKLITGVFDNNSDVRGLLMKIALATIVSVVVVLALEYVIFSELNMAFVAWGLVLTGIAIVVSEHLYKKNKGSNFSIIHAILVGVAQGIAAIPGISRSGASIAYLLSSGMPRKTAVDISFLLSIPILILSLIWLCYIDDIGFVVGNTEIFVFFVSFLSSIVSIHLMRNWIIRFWIYFAPYCFVLGIVLLIYIYNS